MSRNEKMYTIRVMLDQEFHDSFLTESFYFIHLGNHAVLSVYNTNIYNDTKIYNKLLGDQIVPLNRHEYWKV